MKRIPIKGIYKISNDNNIYIGSSIDIERREKEHNKNRYNIHDKTNSILCNDGIFEIVNIWDNDDIYLMRIAESVIITEYRLMNINIINDRITGLDYINELYQ